MFYSYTFGIIMYHLNKFKVKKYIKRYKLNYFPVKIEDNGVEIDATFIVPKMAFNFRATIDQFAGSRIRNFAQLVIYIPNARLAFDDFELRYYGMRLNLDLQHGCVEECFKVALHNFVNDHRNIRASADHIECASDFYTQGNVWQSKYDTSLAFMRLVDLYREKFPLVYVYLNFERIMQSYGENVCYALIEKYPVTSQIAVRDLKFLFQLGKYTSIFYEDPKYPFCVLPGNEKGTDFIIQRKGDAYFRTTKNYKPFKYYNLIRKLTR